jgi:hypothetical protein
MFSEPAILGPLLFGGPYQLFSLTQLLSEEEGVGTSLEPGPVFRQADVNNLAAPHVKPYKDKPA